tara:strand:+ start:16 stop:213 length:198 start_codon:yes stop_codon:yes gene_type:complete
MMSILLASLVYSEVEEIMSFTELCEKLEQLDEETVMELLEINTEDLVIRFEDRVELHNERLQKEL